MSGERCLQDLFGQALNRWNRTSLSLSFLKVGIKRIYDSTCLLGSVGMCVKCQPIQHWSGVIWVMAELSWWVSGHLGIELDDDSETLQANMSASTIYQHGIHGIHGILWIYIISYFVLPWQCPAELCLLDFRCYGTHGIPLPHMNIYGIDTFVVPQVENDWD